MPEGDTVHLTARRLRAALAGQVLSVADLRVPALATVDLVGREVLEVVARGKHLLVRLAGGLTLHNHLRMDGSWWVGAVGAPWRGGRAHEVRVLLANESWQAVGFRVHDLALVATVDEHDLVGHLGPDVLGPDWDLGVALERLLADPHRPVAQALSDQRCLAGLGNMYVCEVLFVRGISPWSAVGTVGDLPGLVRTAQRMLQVNLERPEQATTGSLRRGEQHWVHGRAGRPCRRCGTPIAIETQPEQSSGGDPWDRVRFWCPSCQPLGDPAGSA